MLAFGPGLAQGLLATLFYALPALFVAMMVGGLANVRVEGWDAPAEARAWKQRYRDFARWGLRLNRLLFGLFLVQVVALLTLRSGQCDATATHLGAAAWNLASAVDRIFFFGIAIAVVLAVAAIVWAVGYLLVARRNGWADPRRKDGVVVHVALVPLSLLLMAVAFGIVPRMVCPFIVA